MELIMLTRRQSFLNSLPCNFKGFFFFFFPLSHFHLSFYNFSSSHEVGAYTIHLWYNYLPWQQFVNGIVKLQITKRSLSRKIWKKYPFQDNWRVLWGQQSFCLPNMLKQKKVKRRIDLGFVFSLLLKPF